MKEPFVQGPISSLLIAGCISSLATEMAIGGHGIFLGQIRNDLIEGRRVTAIEFSVYQEMAIPIIESIKKEIKERYNLTSVIVYHSLGIIQPGELCLFVHTTSRHRKAAIDACQETVERVKAEVPIWGKEIFENDSYSWKVNT